MTGGLLHYVDPVTGEWVLTEPAPHEHADAIEFYWKYDSISTMANPNVGFVRSNTAAGTPATALAFSNITDGGTDTFNLMKGLTVGDLITAQKSSQAGAWVRYRISGAPILNAGWTQIPVEQVETSGVTLTKNDTMLVRFTYGAGGGATMDARYVKKAGDAMTGQLQVPSLLTSQASIISTNRLGTYNYTAGNQTGYMVITLPGPSTGANNAMVTYRIRGYCLDTGWWEVRVGGYHYASIATPQWYLPNANFYGKSMFLDPRLIPVRLLTKGAQGAATYGIALGEANTVWQYPFITIEADYGYSGGALASGVASTVITTDISSWRVDVNNQAAGVRPFWIAGVGMGTTDLVLSTTSTYYQLTFDALTDVSPLPGNMATTADLSSRGILLRQAWPYLYRLRVTFKSMTAATTSVKLHAMTWDNDGGTLQNGSANEFHASGATSPGSMTVEITSVQIPTVAELPQRLGAQCAAYGAAATVDSASLYAWGPIVG